MERFNYKNITFAEGAKPSFADFKAMYASAEDFKSVPHKKRDAELKRVHKELLAHSNKQLKSKENLDKKTEKDVDNPTTDRKGK